MKNFPLCYLQKYPKYNKIRLISKLKFTNSIQSCIFTNNSELNFVLFLKIFNDFNW